MPAGRRAQGPDTFVFENGRVSARYGMGSTALRDTIPDFSVADHDLIDLTELGYTGFGNGYADGQRVATAIPAP